MEPQTADEKFQLQGQAFQMMGPSLGWEQTSINGISLSQNLQEKGRVPVGRPSQNVSDILSTIAWNKNHLSMYKKFSILSTLSSVEY